jgi:DNA invertase Pin-like site-specific DNA recombinase
MLERTAAGLAAAKVRGNQGGRKPKLSEAKVAELVKLKEQGFPVKRLAEMFHISEPSVYRYLNA